MATLSKIEKYLEDIQRRRRDWYRIARSPPPVKGEDAPFSIPKHVKYLQMHLGMLPSSAATQETNR